MNSYRLLELAKFLDNLPVEKFDYSIVINHSNSYFKCGSAACAIGWCPAVPALKKHVSWAKWNGVHCDTPKRLSKIDGSVFVISELGRTTYAQVGMELFDLSYADSDWLFSPDDLCGNDATPKEVASKIRKFVADNK